MTREEMEHIIFCYQEVVLFESNKSNNSELLLQLEYNLQELIAKYHSIYGGNHG